MKKVVLTSELNVNEILDRLKAVTEKFQTDSGKKYLFEGKIFDSNFVILPTFDFGPRNQLRPEIKGSVKNISNHSFIELEFKLPSSLSLLFIVAAIINIVVIVILFINPIDSFCTWKFFTCFFIFTAIIFYISFKSKIDSSISILNRTLQAKIDKSNGF